MLRARLRGLPPEASARGRDLIRVLASPGDFWAEGLEASEKPTRVADRTFVDDECLALARSAAI